MNNYVVYHLHTELSLLDSCTNYKLYIDRAKELGQTAICFTEHGNTFNWVDKKMYCDKNGIKYMHGVEIYLTRTHEEKVRDNFHTILIAKNYDGLKELNLLIDLSTQQDHFYYKNRLSFEEFLNISDNIIKISACLASPLNRLDSNDPYYYKLLNKYDYLEIQYHNSDEQIEYNKKLYALSKEYGKNLIVGTDTHSIHDYKAECRSILQKAKKIEYASEDKYDLTYKSYQELMNMFTKQGSLPDDVVLQAVDNTNIMAESVESFTLDLSFKYPVLYKNDEEVFKSVLRDKFKYKVNNGIIKSSDVDGYKNAIIEEFKVFKKLNMIGFMLFMSELLTWCRDNNIPYGYCRGSVGGSRIAYILDVIDLDPEIWNTVFSRFANEHRLEIGDIDCDFAPSQRQLVYNYIINRFGEDKTAYILAIGTISDKGTIDEIGRALDYPLDLVSKIKADYDVNQEQTKKENPELFYYFEGMLGTAVSQSMHPAGIVASPVSLPDNYGTIWKDGKRIMSINMEEIHEVSLVKYDILGLKNIEIIKDCRELAGLKYPLSYQINWNDDAVWNDMVESPVGIFQFEGQYAFSLLKDYKPKKINDMSMVNAALRPSGESYRDRLIAGEVNKNPSVQIDELLKDNNGFLVFQEDTTKFLQDICGFSGSDADNVRRAIGRKDKERLDKALPQILDGYCSKSSSPRDIAEQEAMAFLKIIEDSSSYQFGFNHSTGYSMIGYTCAHDRYYHTLEFVAAYLNNANNEDDIRMGTLLAKQKGITISSIKFRHSKSKYTIDKPSNTVYKGISSIKFLNEQVAEDLYSLRDKQYNSFTELLIDLTTTSINSRQLRILTTLNFFSEFGKSKKLMQVIEAFDLLYGRKQLKFDQLVDLPIDADLIMKHSKTQTAKIIKDIDIVAIISEYEQNLPDDILGIKERLKSEFEYMGYIEFKNERIDKNIYYVLEQKFFKDKTKPYLQIYQLKTGDIVKTKITVGETYMSNPFRQGDLIVVDEFRESNKTKNVNGKWVKTDEKEYVIKSYSVY